jgi:hypothetical protein
VAPARDNNDQRLVAHQLVVASVSNQCLKTNHANLPPWRSGNMQDQADGSFRHIPAVDSSGSWPGRRNSQTPGNKGTNPASDILNSAAQETPRHLFMKSSSDSGIVIAVTLGLVLAVPVIGGDGVTVPVKLSPKLEALLRDKYGADEGPLLGSYVADSLSKALQRADTGCKYPLDVTIVDAQPTHPTRKQQADNPAVDPIRTVYVGGAELTGHVRNAAGLELTAVKYRRFAPTIRWVTPGADYWGDAHLTMDQFTSQLLTACRSQPVEPAASP